MGTEEMTAKVSGHYPDSCEQPLIRRSEQYGLQYGHPDEFYRRRPAVSGA